MTYKLLAFDMDGTLLNSQKKISPKTLAAISELSRRGVFVAVSTGRGVAEMAEHMEKLNFMHYGILESGGLVYNFFNETPVALHTIEESIAQKIIDAGIIENTMIHIHTIKGSIQRAEDIKNAADFQIAVYQEMYERISTHCDDFKKFVHEHSNEILKINLYHRNLESRLRSLERLKNLNITLAFSEITSLESSPKGVTKGAGLVELCKFLNIDVAETVAVGDAPNDIDILKTAGIAAVMGNASDEIKKFADFVTDDNDHDGIVKVIEKYFYNH